MSKTKFVSISLITILIICGLPLVFELGSEHATVKAAVRTVDDDGEAMYTTISDAITAANPGDTIYVWAGTYNENVVISKTLNLIGNGSINTTIDGQLNGNGIYINADNVKVKGLQTINCSGSWTNGAGIFVYNSKYCEIEYCNSSNNDDSGIYLRESQENLIKNNICLTNNQFGIFLWDANESTIENNNCSDNPIGIYLDSSENNTLTNNNGSFNTVEGGIQIYDGHHNVIQNNYCYNNPIGIRITSSSKYNLIANNTCDFNSIGIYIQGVSKNIIRNNSFVSNVNEGIKNWFYSDDNIFENNNCSNNKYGICINKSKNTIIANNSIFSNNITGIQLSKTDNNIFLNNTLINNNMGFNIILNTIDCQILNTTIYNSTTYDIQFNGDSHANALNCSFNASNIKYIDTLSNLTVQWYLHVNVTNTSNLPVSGADITVKDNTSKVIYSGQTGILGFRSWIICSEYIESQTGKISILTPHNITAAQTPYEEGYADPEPFMDSSKMVYIVLYPDITPPAPATNLIFDIIYGTYINMSWTNSTSHDLEGYNIYINDTGSSTTFHLLNTTMNNYFNVTGLIEEIKYYFIITAYDDALLESTNLTGFNTTPDVTPPSPPSSLLIIKIGGTYIELSWAASSSADLAGYEVYVNDTGSAVNFHVVTTTTNLNFNHTGLVEETNYYYQVRAFDEVPLYSFFSNMVFATTFDITAPTAPTGLVAQDPTGTSISIAWTANTELDVEGYLIYINDTGAGSTGPFHWVGSATGTSTGYIAASLIEETTYYFVIAAYDEVPNNSTFSGFASATTLDVTAPAMPTGLEATVLSGTEISLTWNANTETDLAGYIIFMNNTNKGQSGPYHIINTTTGTGTSHTVSGLYEEMTYYFRIRAYDEVPNNSLFSVVVSGTTPDETPPLAPAGLEVKNPTKNSLKISWDANLEDDVVGYNLSRSTTASGPFAIINIERITGTQYVDTGLIELTTYYYTLKAIDDVELESGDSAVAFGTTELGPHAPEINNSVADFAIVEDTYDDTSINLKDWFIDINDDALTFRSEGEDHLEVEIFQGNGTVTLLPEENWNGLETLTFYASDGVIEVNDQVNITVTAVNDPPETPDIRKPNDNTKIDDGDALDFRVVCIDPDVEYGDVLEFKWHSDISGELGNDKTLNGVILPIGKHTISVEVTDQADETTTASITVTVDETASSDTDGDTLPNIWERDNGLDPADATDVDEDPDSDGLSNLEEYTETTDPQDDDTDDDGLTDGDEVNLYGTRPTRADTDRDGHNDGEDRYPLDSTRWKKEAEPEDNTWLYLGLIIIIIIVVIIVIFLFGIKPKMRKKAEEEEPTPAEPDTELPPEGPPAPYQFPYPPEFQQVPPQPPSEPITQEEPVSEEEPVPEEDLEDEEPIDVKMLAREGAIAYGDGRYDDAIIAWQQVLQHEPEDHPEIDKAIQDAVAKLKSGGVPPETEAASEAEGGAFECPTCKATLTVDDTKCPECGEEFEEEE